MPRINPNILNVIDRALSAGDAPPAGLVDPHARQCNPATNVTCDLQKFNGEGWESVLMVRDREVENPNRAVQQWLENNREPDARYRLARSIRTVVITVDPA